MSKKARKKAQQEAMRRATEARKQELWNPDLPEDELRHFHATCERMFAAMRDISRPASVIAKPEYDQAIPKSHVGGSMLLPNGSQWPATNGQPLSAVLEIHLGELPYCPSLLQKHALLQVYLELSPDEIEPRYTDGAWHVQLVSDISQVLPRSEGMEIAEFSIAWKLLEHDTPTYPDNLGMIDKELEKAFHSLPSCNQLMADRFPAPLCSRVGGWPHWVEGQDLDGEFCLQVFGQDVGVDFGFDGSLYFGLNGLTGEWACTWEIG